MSELSVNLEENGYEPGSGDGRKMGAEKFEVEQGDHLARVRF
jgi:hypothetical protein